MKEYRFKWMKKVNLLSQDFAILINGEKLVTPVLDVLNVFIRVVGVVLAMSVFGNHDLATGLQPVLFK